MKKLGELKKLDLQLLNNTRNSWKESIGEEVFISKYSDLFQSIHFDLFVSKENDDSVLSDHEAMHFGFFEKNKDYATAILAVTTTKVQRLTKVLNIHLKPYNDEENLSIETLKARVEEIAKIYVQLIMNLLKLSSLNEGEVKVYARTEFELEIFQKASNIIQSQGIDIAKTHGRWLVLDISKK